MKSKTPSGILLDIEGTTSSISFVHDVMFPFALKHLEPYLREHNLEGDLLAACNQIAVDAGHASLDSWSQEDSSCTALELVINEVRRLMANDVKATGLKALQGLIWKQGFDSGELQAHVYPDVLPAIQKWRSQSIDVRIYSSGSISAQKLFFGHLESHGNCLDLFSGHYDTRIGGKKETQSYLNIAADWSVDPQDILFISDIADELLAAKEAGVQVLASVRPGNHPLPDDFPVASIESFEQVDF